MDSDVRRLAELICMLPNPSNGMVFEDFWRKVADDNDTSRHYIMEKITEGLTQATDNTSRTGQLAEYSLMFFNYASDDLSKAIAREIEIGAATPAVGERWLEDLRATAWTVIFNRRKDSSEAVDAWRAFKWWEVND